MSKNTAPFLTCFTDRWSVHIRHDLILKNDINQRIRIIWFDNLVYLPLQYDLSKPHNTEFHRYPICNFIYQSFTCYVKRVTIIVAFTWIVWRKMYFSMGLDFDRSRFIKLANFTSKSNGSPAGKSPLSFNLSRSSWLKEVPNSI